MLKLSRDHIRYRCRGCIWLGLDPADAGMYFQLWLPSTWAYLFQFTRSLDEDGTQEQGKGGYKK